MIAEDKKQLAKFKKQVEKFYTKPYTKQVSLNYFTVESLNEDFEPIDILLEQYFLPTKTELEAWKLAASVCKTTQNINRTHPIKVELADSEGKYERVQRRRMKNVKQ